MRALVCVHPDHDHALPSLRWIWPTERISGGHTSVGAMPRSYQVTPVILDGGGRHRKSRSDHKADRRKVSQPAAVQEPNQRAGQNLRPSSRQVLTEANSGSLASAAARPCLRVRAGMPSRGASWLRLSRYRSSLSGQSGPAAWLLWWPSASAVNDRPDTRDQIRRSYPKVNAYASAPGSRNVTSSVRSRTAACARTS